MYVSMKMTLYVRVFVYKLINIEDDTSVSLPDSR